MAKRKSKAKRSRSRRQTFSILGTAKTLAVANVLTQGAANSNLFEFVTGRMSNPNMSGGTAYYQPNNADSIITLPELLGIDRKARTVGGVFYPPMTHTASPSMAITQMTNNIKENAVSMGVSAVVTIAGFRIADKVLGKAGIKRGVNKTMRFIGLNEVKA